MLKVLMLVLLDFNVHLHVLTHTLFNGHSPEKPDLASFPFDSHARGFDARRLYKQVPLLSLNQQRQSTER